MKLLFKPGFLMATLALAALLAAPPAARGHAGHDHGDEPSIALPDVVAQVNGTDIPKSAILASLKSSIRKYKERGLPLTGDQEKIAARKLIDNAVSRRLLLDRAGELGIQAEPAEVAKRLEKVRRGFKSEKAFLHKLEDENLTLDQYKKELAEEIRIDAVLKKELGGDIRITDEQVREYYRKHRSDYDSPEKRRARVMLIRVKKDAGPEAEKKARETLLALLAEIRGGKDFGDLARKHSQDTLASRGGDLGFFVKEKMFGPFAERAFAMKVGEITEPFRTRHGYQILQLTDVQPAVSRSLDEVRDEIREILLKREIKKRTPAYLAKLKRQARIKLYF